jgi:D-alanyl-D-alanine carboxypeptidase/D-alanyl-D-alanine-endopeptidase (penicillin-binding protein 4)
VAVRPVPRPRLTARGRAALRIAGTLALVAAAVCVVLGVRDDADAAATPADDRAAATALASARRVPYLFTDAVAAQRLVGSMTEFVGNNDMCTTVDDTSTANGTMVRVNGDRPLIPASTMKVLTAASALAVLGPEHTFTTRVVGNNDTLTLVGAADPVLTTPAYEARLRAAPGTRTDVVTPFAPLADAIAAAGVTSVGTLFVDDARHDDLRFLPEWNASYVEDVGPLGALTVDDGTDAGARVADPALNAGTQLARLLAERGVAVGGVAHGGAPDGAPEIAAVTSPPIADIVASLLTSSDNLTAEMLTREIGVARGGDGTTAAGVQASTAALTELGVPMANVALHDGSGLSRENRATCDALLAALHLATDPRFAAIDRGLAVAASTGTLANRLVGDPLAGVLRGKTGNLSGVQGIVGVVDDPEHLRFAFLVNGTTSTGQGRTLEVDAARRVAAFPEAPPPAELVPTP